jgi:hypothetical protein
MIHLRLVTLRQDGEVDIAEARKRETGLLRLQRNSALMTRPLEADFRELHLFLLFKKESLYRCN